MLTRDELHEQLEAVESQAEKADEARRLKELEVENARLKRLEGILIKTAGVLIFSMSAIVYASLTLHR